MSTQNTQAANEGRTLVDIHNGYCMEIVKVKNEYFMSLYAIKDGKMDPVYDSNNNAYWNNTTTTIKGVMEYLAEAMTLAKPKTAGDLPRGETMMPCADYALSVGKDNIFHDMAPHRKDPKRGAAILASYVR